MFVRFLSGYFLQDLFKEGEKLLLSCIPEEEPIPREIFQRDQILISLNEPGSDARVAHRDG